MTKLTRDCAKTVASRDLRASDMIGQGGREIFRAKGWRKLSARWPQVARTLQDKRQKTANGEEVSTFEIASEAAADSPAVAEPELEMVPAS